MNFVAEKNGWKVGTGKEGRSSCTPIKKRRWNIIGARARSFFHFNKLGTMFHPCVRGNFSVKAIAVCPSTRQSYMPRVCFEISAVSGEFFVSHILPSSSRLIGTKLESSSKTILQSNVERSSKEAIYPKRFLEKEFQEISRKYRIVGR